MSLQVTSDGSASVPETVWRVLIGREARTKHKARGVEPPAVLWQAGRRNERGNTRLTGSWPGWLAGVLFYAVC